MNTNNRIRAAKLGYIIVSALLCALGIVLIVMPDFSASVLCHLGGLLMILFGLVKIVGYCSKDLYRLAFQYDLALGILLLALGAVFLLRANIMVYLIWIFLGVFILSDALLKIQIAIDSRVFGIRQWWLIFSAAIATGIIGFLLIFCPSESRQTVMILLGVSLLFEGILNLITTLTAVRIIRKQLPSTQDAEYIEIEQET